MYNQIIAQINDYVKANANNEITGDGLNTILLSMLNALGTGMSFCGIAEPTTTPISNEYPKFYIAFTPGNYSHFLNNPPTFTSGFAIIQDDSGSNTWSMTVKPFNNKVDTFLVDAKIEDSLYQSTDYFYIKNASRNNNNCTFTVYKTNVDNTSETLVGTFSTGTLQSGYKAHKVTTSNNTVFNIAVNWDKVEIGTTETYTYSDTAFPITAYVSANNDTDAKVEELVKRLYIAEYVLGYKVNTESLQNQFSRNNTYEFGTTFYVLPNTTIEPSLRLPSTLDGAYNNGNGNPWELHKCSLGYTASAAGAADCIIQLKPGNFPANTESTLYLANTDTNNSQPIIIQNIDASDNVVSRFTDTIPPASIIKIGIIRYVDMSVGSGGTECLSLKLDLFKAINI